MKKKVLITGACGFAGRYMCKYLSDLKDRPYVIGTDITSSESKACDAFYTTDLSSGKDTADLIKNAVPDYIIHFASTFGTNDSQEIYKVNILSATALLEAIRIHKGNIVVIMTGSAAEYGKVPEVQLPVTEDTPCRPVTPYGLSKLLATQAALYYHRLYGLNVMIVRPFQLIGKSVTNKLAPGAFFEQITNAQKSNSKIIKVGNLDNSRDFLDVRDATEAIWMLCRNPAPGEIFNLCSGRPTKIRDLLSMMIEASGIEFKIEIDQKKLRDNTDVSILYGSCRKLYKYYGWEPKIELRKSIEDMGRC